MLYDDRCYNAEKGDSYRSSADVLFDDTPTSLTLDVAAPVKLAVAPLDDATTSHVVPATAAHELAAVDAARRPVTEAAVSAARPRPTVRLAEVGRLTQVDEIGVAGRLELRVPRHQFTSRTAHQLLLNLHSQSTHRHFHDIHVLYCTLSRRATNRHLPYETTPCYLPPDK